MIDVCPTCSLSNEMVYDQWLIQKSDWTNIGESVRTFVRRENFPPDLDGVGRGDIDGTGDIDTDGDAEADGDADGDGDGETDLDGDGETDLDGVDEIEREAVAVSFGDTVGRPGSIE